MFVKHHIYFLWFKDTLQPILILENKNSKKICQEFKSPTGLKTKTYNVSKKNSSTNLDVNFNRI